MTFTSLTIYGIFQCPCAVSTAQSLASCRAAARRDGLHPSFGPPGCPWLSELFLRAETCVLPLYGGCLSSAVCVQPSSLWLFCAAYVVHAAVRCWVWQWDGWGWDGMRSAYPGAGPCCLSAPCAQMDPSVTVCQASSGVQPPTSSQGVWCAVAVLGCPHCRL